MYKQPLESSTAEFSDEQKKKMEEQLKCIEHELRLLNNDVQNFKLREFSRAQQQDLYLP